MPFIIGILQMENFRIYEYFMDLHNQKENADFLKEYGLVANPVRYLANSSSNSEHDAKGILPGER